MFVQFHYPRLLSLKWINLHVTSIVWNCRTGIVTSGHCLRLTKLKGHKSIFKPADYFGWWSDSCSVYDNLGQQRVSLVRVQIGFLVRGRVRIKIWFRVRVRVRVGVTFNVINYHRSNCRRSKILSYIQFGYASILACVVLWSIIQWGKGLKYICYLENKTYEIWNL